jgi:hypothetical protein
MNPGIHGEKLVTNHPSYDMGVLTTMLENTAGNRYLKILSSLSTNCSEFLQMIQPETLSRF